MKLDINNQILERYKSNSQIIRVASEKFVAENLFCPSCGNELHGFENNRPVADFFCSKCAEEFELKSKQNNLGAKVNDGAYETMIKRISSANNPNFFFLSYNPKTYQVNNLFVTPKYFFTPQLIEKRAALREDARRAGWVGCNILINQLPESGKIQYINNGQLEDKNKILHRWEKTIFLKQQPNNQKGWVLDVMAVIEQLGQKEFYLRELYAFESYFKKLHPDNQNIQAKIRQQLQFLRDKEYLSFLGNGCYRLNNS